MQILKYEVNKSDYNKHEPQSSSGHDWLVTILLYLSGVKLGGQTVFPESEVVVSLQGRFEEPECSNLYTFVLFVVKKVKCSYTKLFTS